MSTRVNSTNLDKIIIQKGVMTISLAFIILSFVFSFHYLAILSGLAIYFILIDYKRGLKFYFEIFRTVEKFGSLLLKFILSTIYFLFVAPYSMTVKFFQKKNFGTTLWVDSEFDYTKKEYFKQPW